MSQQHTPQYIQIASDLRNRIDSGEFQPGTKLPAYDALTRHYDVGRGVIKEALSLLEVEGRVRVVTKSGTVVLAPSQRERVNRGREVFRNELGYVFNQKAGHWPPLETPRRWWGKAPAEVAQLLQVATDADVLVRHRVVGPVGGSPMQSVTSYLPESVARGTAIEEASTGPGGIYDRLEHDLGHGPLLWEEEVGTQIPTAEEARELEMSKAVPMLVITRTSTSSSTGRVVEVSVTRMSGARFKIGYPITRSKSARWPVQPATAENTPRQSDTPDEAA